MVRIQASGVKEFDGRDFLRFLDLYECAADVDGASDYDKSRQIIFFFKGDDLKDELREMEGYQNRDWSLLVREMKARWGRYKPKPRYTVQDLWSMADEKERKGGIVKKEEYRDFMRPSLITWSGRST